MNDFTDFYTGDPRRCPSHPNFLTSSPCGRFDTPCGACEADMEDGDGASSEAFVSAMPDESLRLNDYSDDDIPF